MDITFVGFIIGVIISGFAVACASYFLKKNKFISGFFTIFPFKILAVFIVFFLYTEKSSIIPELKEFTKHLYKWLFLLGILFYLLHLYLETF
tara:strand:+ start:256 stop:531 length:276 start_codon:yes stop_codon:yes gene_type:complete